MEETSLPIYLVYISGDFHKVCSSKTQAEKYIDEYFNYQVCSSCEYEIKEQDLTFETGTSEYIITKSIYDVYYTLGFEDICLDSFSTREEAQKFIVNECREDTYKWHEIREKQMTFTL